MCEFFDILQIYEHFAKKIKIFAHKNKAKMSTNIA